MNSMLLTDGYKPGHRRQYQTMLKFHVRLINN